MEENKPKEFKAGEPRTTDIGVNFKQEYTDSFNKALLYSKLATTAMEYTRSTNPAKVVLTELAGLDDNTKKDCQDRITGQMQTWLGTFEQMLEEGKTLPVDLIGLAADLARKDRGRK